jgi:ketosteroid isomerase-like protein
MPSTRGTLAGPILRRVSQPNLEVVQALFDRFAEGGIEPTLELFSKDVVIEIPADMSAEPDVYHGREGVRRYFAGFGGMIEDVRYEALELIPVGELVLAHVRLSGRGASSGLDVALEPYVLHELAEGKLIRIRPYPDRAAAERAIAGADRS